MRSILVRHGQSESNLDRYIAGRMDVSLTKKGTEQPKKTAEELKNEKIDICFCSPLKRAKDTAKEILKFHSNTKVIYDKRITNRDLGEAEGKPFGFLFGHIEAFEGEFNDFKPKGGESAKDLIERTKPFLDDLLSYEGKTVLLVAHNWNVRIILSILLHKSVEELYKNTEIANASIIKLELKNKKFLEVF